MKHSIRYMLFSFLIAGCSGMNARITRVNEVIDSLHSQFAPDPRTAVFDISARAKEDSVVLSGETDNIAAKEALLRALSGEGNPPTIDSVVVLPEKSLSDSVYGIVDVSVGNIYHAPTYKSELVSQVLLGHTVKVLKQHHGWLFVQSSDKYLGWAQPAVVTRTDSAGLAAYKAKRKLIMTSVFSTVTSGPSPHSATISDAVMADVLLPTGRKGASYEIEFPDGRTGFVSSKDVEYRDTYEAQHKPTAAGVQRVAEELVGFPYLWGGTSTKGVDCSGFTKSVYRMNDIRLPRDASQQVNVGTNVEPGPDFRNLKKGDLLFFGKKAENGKPWKIVHVAIYLGNGYFIQSADRVQINGLLKSDTAYDPYELNRFVTARRILPSE